MGVVAGKTVGLPQSPMFPNYTNNDRQQADLGRARASDVGPLGGFCRFWSSAEQQHAEEETGQHDLSAEGE